MTTQRKGHNKQLKPEDPKPQHGSPTAAKTKPIKSNTLSGNREGVTRGSGIWGNDTEIFAV